MSTPDEMGLTIEAAQGYEQHFVPAIFDQWPPSVTEAAEIIDGDKVLEVGCGTGVFARYVIEHVGVHGSVAGIDLSENMLQVARATCPQVDFQSGDAMDLPFNDATFDAVASCFMLMFVTNPVVAVNEMWRVLRPGGRLVVTVWEDLNANPVYSALAEIARRCINADAAISLATPFMLGDAGRLSKIFASAGVSEITVSEHQGNAIFPSLDDFVRTEIQAWVLATSVDEANLHAVITAARSQFQHYCDADGRANFPLNALLVKATKA